jgi:hypothetical protein
VCGYGGRTRPTPAWALLNSWDRNNTILLNLLGALPEGGLEARSMEGSPTIAELFTHIHFVRSDNNPGEETAVIRGLVSLSFTPIYE